MLTATMLTAALRLFSEMATLR